MSEIKKLKQPTKTIYTMRKYLFFIACIFFSILCFAQSKYSVEEVDSSSDFEVLANFLKHNPDHERSLEFKHKLIVLLLGSNTAKIEKPTESVLVAKTPTEAVTEMPVESVVPVASSQDLLARLFGSDSADKNTAYIEITNKTECNLTLEIKGEKTYSLKIDANKKAHILLDKGNYTTSGKLCSGEHFSTINVTDNVLIALYEPKDE